jgi:hypothetical protein
MSQETAVPDQPNDDDPQPRDIALEQATPEQVQHLEDLSEHEDEPLAQIGEDAGTPLTT